MKLIKSFTIIILLIVMIILIFACDQEPAPRVEFSFTFDSDNERWTGGFADLPVEHAQQGYDVNFSYAKIPVPNAESNGLLITGNNHSDDLFMYITRQISSDDGLEADTKYSVRLSFKMATEVPPGMMGIGGSPGESVYIKAGIISKKPEVIEQAGNYVMNIDKGVQSQGGNDATVLGDAAKGEGLGQNDQTFRYKKFDLTKEVIADSEGNIWVIIGADSGFEGISRLYFDDISISFNPILPND